MRDSRNKDRKENKAGVAPQSINLDQTENTKLVERATGGDSEAFGKLYSIYLDRIYRYVFYQVKDKPTAEDITEDVFIKAWKAINSCNGREQTFLPWLFRIAHNLVIDVFRRKRKELLVDMETVAEVGDHSLEVGKRLEQQQLLRVIDSLPQNQRQVIILKFIEGLDNREIGQVIRKNQGAIRILQMRALATLRKRLKEKRIDED
ncbi:RNA polymerase sigma factor [Chloroflexota bacterium]